jgi:hypothetical protein
MSSDTEKTADASSDHRKELTAFLRLLMTKRTQNKHYVHVMKKRGKLWNSCCLPVLAKTNDRTQRAADIPQMNRVVVYKWARSQLILEARSPRHAQNLTAIQFDERFVRRRWGYGGMAIIGHHHHHSHQQQQQQQQQQQRGQSSPAPLYEWGASGWS